VPVHVMPEAAADRRQADEGRNPVPMVGAIDRLGPADDLARDLF